MYWKALMRHYGIVECKEYNAYTTAYNKKEAVYNIRNELLDDEQGDEILAITEIDEEEYIEGYKQFGDGIREVMI